MFRVALHFQDGEQFDLAVAAGQSVAEAALDAGIALRSDCLSGTCGSCLAHCREGAFLREPLDYPIIDADEMAAGLYPACKLKLASDAALRLDYPLRPEPTAPTRFAGELVEIEKVADTVSRLRIALPNDTEFRFQPGQYVRLRPPGLRVARAYSIASAPSELPSIELLIRHVPGGAISGWLESDAARAGARMTVHGPLGGFALDDSAARSVFIAGGTGLAPVLSMIRAQAGTRPMVLSFGCTSPADLFLVDSLRALAATTPGLDLRIALVNGAEGDIIPGSAVSALAGADLADARFHLCGPPAMVDAARIMLRDQGVDPAMIRSERFAPGG